MKRGPDSQSQFVQLCKDLFSLDSKLKEITDLIEFFNKTSLQDLDFNVEIEEAPFKGMTLLAIIVELAFRERFEPLEIILKKANSLKLDFNVLSSWGTLLQTIALLAANGNNQKVLQLILDTIDFKNLNFNAISNVNNNTALHWIMIIAAQGNIRPLETLLNKADLSLLNFNIKSNDGESPLWWLAFFLVNKQINSKSLMRLFASQDISQLDFNEKVGSISVLSLLTTAAMQGQVEPLQMILRKDVVSKFAFDEQMGRVILLNLLFTAMNGYPEPLKIFLSNDTIACAWPFDKNEKEVLFQGKKDEINKLLINIISNKRSILKPAEVFSACLTSANTNLALACIKAGINKNILYSLLINAIRNGQCEFVNEISPYCEWSGIPNLTMLNENNTLMNNTIKIDKFLIDPHAYLSAHQLYTEEIYECLELKLSQYCEGLFSANGKFCIDEISEILSEFLQIFPLHKINFNYVLEKGPFKGNTLLWVIALAAYKGHPFLLKIILSKLNEEEISKLNFNANPSKGKYNGKTILWLIAKLGNFSNNSKWSEIIWDIFTIILNKADISKLDFNAKAAKGAYRNQTVLLLMSKSKDLSLLLLSMLIKNGMTTLDFFAKEARGATTPIWWLARGAAEHKNPTPFQFVLEKSDISAHHLNSKSNSNTTLLYMTLEAAAHGLVAPLEIVLKKVVISDLDFDSHPKGRATITFLLILVIIAGYHELIKSILLQRKIDSEWFDENASKVLFEKSQDEINSYFIDKIKNKITKKNENYLETLIRFGYTNAALASMEGASDIIDINSALYDAKVYGYQETVKRIFPYYQLYGVPISKIVMQEAFFDLDNINSFLQSDDQFSFIQSFCSKLTYTCLNILRLHKEVNEYKTFLLVGDETVSSDSKVFRSKSHFCNIVQPAFNTILLSFGETKENAIFEIEKNIRSLLLNKILEQANATITFSSKILASPINNSQIQKYKRDIQSAQKVINFVIQNKQKLIDLDINTMKKSVNKFTSQNRNDTAQSAWRGFNPFAPVSGKNPNLLTPPLNDEKIWTTEIDNEEGQRDPHEVYSLLREWIAYYYLAVMDKTDGDEDICQTRIENFIGQLSDIRNARGIDDPSCFPGTLTRIADMGAFHSIAKLPPTTEELLIDYFKEEILNLFQKKLESLPSLNEKEALYCALTTLNRYNAKELIMNPTSYHEKWMIMREDFIKEISDITENKFLKIPVVIDDYIFIEQILNDIGGINKIYTALSNCFNNYIDWIPTDEELAKANPFEHNTVNYKRCQLILNSILNLSSNYRKSGRKLNVLTTFLNQKIPTINKNGKFEDILQGLELEPEILNEINYELQNMNLSFKSFEIINPFDEKVSAILKSKKMLERLNNLQNKQTQFNRYYSRVKDLFKDCKDVTVNFISHFTEALVTFIDSYKIWNVEKFKSEFQDNKLAELDDSDTFFLYKNFNELSKLKLEDQSDDYVQNTENYTPSFTTIKNVNSELEKEKYIQYETFSKKIMNNC